MSALLPTIGLEVHAELNTRSKLFCSCPNNPDEKEPNLNICPVCLGHPGTLPVLNKAAVMAVLRVGLALRGRLADFTEFDRKNYFYPDIPKGYQISQYKYPLVSGGELLGVQLTRIHLEEDTARSQHDTHATHSLVDFNRAGVPLMELVTEPVVTSAKQAADFARELQLLLRYLNVSEANLEKGELRIEANISVGLNPEGVGRTGTPVLGTKVEVKNLNSFRSVERAIEHELKRQAEVLEQGELVIQETRGWDEVKGTTFSQRQKESSHDYRYFPEPDLPKLKISEVPEFQNLEATLPELPWQKRERYINTYKLKPEDAEIFVQDEFLGAMFEGVSDYAPNKDSELIGIAGNYIIHVLVDLLKNSTLQSKLGYLSSVDFYGAFFKLMQMIKDKEVSSHGAKLILSEMYLNCGDPHRIAEEKNLFQKSDESHLTEIVTKIISENAQSIADYKSGKQAALQFLVGQGMKESKGAANPEVLKKLLLERLAT